ncbi:MAG: DUF2937 family protein [Pseudomonadota bacterium]
MIRAICLVCGLAGAGMLSQAPEFSQQYVQRLAGQVDELSRIAMEFDATALAEGKGREEMLLAMADTPLVAGQAVMWRATFARQARLTENLSVLRAAGPLERLTLVHRMADPKTLHAVWTDYTPAVPINSAGAVAAAGGFLGGWVSLALLLSLTTRPFRSGAKRNVARPRKPKMQRGDPPVTRPLPETAAAPTPRLGGVQRFVNN